jgi:hypothetical protein
MNVKTLAVLALLATFGCAEKAVEQTETTEDPLRACSTSASCGRKLFCAHPDGACGGRGTCTAVPEMCIEIYKPVCGCDGKTYGNACVAAGARTSVRHEGPCECDEGTFTSTTIDGALLAAAPWESKDELLQYSFDTDGTFASSDSPPCRNASPPCMVPMIVNTGTFSIEGHEIVRLDYGNGNVAVLTPQRNCRGAMRLTGTDYGRAIEVYQRR